MINRRNFLKTAAMTFSGVLIGPSNLRSNRDKYASIQKRYSLPAIVSLDKRFEKYMQSNAAVERLWTGGRTTLAA